ncbi:MAG: topoisomerase DNA-binding C4 zinc finger domain-containing protein, partial [Campylobacterota bacterium]|nr:topoisomerase DNA-binding C4 zinc finger domain-containing protein [Campylobacterota bacterium]
CPKCGSELILRVARKGANAGNEFYGCSNYPKCRYTTQVV